MQKKALLVLLCFVQACFLLFLLFEAPTPIGHLKVALEELQTGMLPSADALTQKSLDQLKEHVSYAKSGYEFQASLCILAVFLTVLVLSIVLFANRTKGSRVEKSESASPKADST